jgi:hypothetical protein
LADRGAEVQSGNWKARDCGHLGKLKKTKERKRERERERERERSEGIEKEQKTK